MDSLPPNAGVVTAPASVDTSAAEAMLADASTLIDSGNTAIVVDAAAVSEIDAGGSAGLSWLAASVKSRGATVHIYNVSATLAITLGDAINAFDSARVN